MVVLGPLFALTSATAAAASLNLRRTSTFSLAAYVLLAGQTVLVLEALSLLSAMTSTNFVLVEGCLAAATIAGAAASGARFPRVRLTGVQSAAARHPLLLALGVAVGIGLGYELALAVLTPPNNWDSMTYHLSRAAAWRQQHRMGYVQAHTSREDVNPVNAEALILASFLVAHSDRIAAVWQWLAELASLIGIYVIAIRTGVPKAAAIFAGLVFATLSQVALQATTTENDLITASFIVAAIALIGTDERHREPLAAAALGLALGTKLTAVFALPAVALIAAFLVPRRLWPRVVTLTVAMTLLFASYAFAENVIHSGSLLGSSPENRAQLVRSLSDPLRTIGLTAVSFVLDPGGVPFGRADEDRSYFGPLGVILILPLVVAALRSARRRDRLRGSLAASLPIYLLGLACVYRFNPWMGRFFVTPVALAAPLAATVYGKGRRRTIVAAVAVATLTASLTLDHAKPAGLGRQSIWTMDRTDAQSTQRPGMRPVLRALDGAVPKSATVAAAIGVDDWDYPLYGPRLTRRVVELDGNRLRGELAASQATWLLLRRRYLAGLPIGWQSLSFRRTGLVLACAPSPTCAKALRAVSTTRPRRGSRGRGRPRSGPS